MPQGARDLATGRTTRPARAARRRIAASIGVAGAALLGAGQAEGQAQVSQSVLDTGIPFDLPVTERVSVPQRRHPETDPLGIRAGAFLLYPKTDVSTNFTDNVFGARANKDSDAYFTLNPRIDAQSTWSRHNLNAHAEADLKRYASYPIRKENGYNVGADGRLDVFGDSNIRAAINADRIYISQFSGDFPQFAGAPVPLDRLVASTRGTYAVNRITLVGDVNWTKLRYRDTRTLDGRVIDQEYLNRTATRFIGRAEYNVSPVTSFFIQGNYVQHRYDDTTGVLNRSGDEIRVVGGAAFDITPLIRTRVGVGYLSRSFRDASVPNLTGLALDGQIDYLVTQLTTISFAAKRDVRDAVLINSPGYTSIRFAAQIDHELLRNLILTGRADREADDFAQIDRTDTLYHFGAGGAYTANRHMVFMPMVDYFIRTSSGTELGQRFKELRAGLSFTLRQ
jgi:hypothetical protein